MGRFRKVSALFALMALVFSIFETANAYACERISAEQQQMPEHAQHDSSAPAPAHQQHGQMPDCPLGLAQGCAVSASLPSIHTFSFESAPEHAVTITADASVIDLITFTTIFHPPRA